MAPVCLGMRASGFFSSPEGLDVHNPNSLDPMPHPHMACGGQGPHALNKPYAHTAAKKPRPRASEAFETEGCCKSWRSRV